MDNWLKRKKGQHFKYILGLTNMAIHLMIFGLLIMANNFILVIQT